MGWAYGEVNGREVGYSVEATCDKEGCEAKIDRGLAYCCGGMHGGDEYSCGGYFCSAHRTHPDREPPEGMPYWREMCESCCEAIDHPVAEVE